MSSAQIREQLFSKIRSIENPLMLKTIDLFVSQWAREGEAMVPAEKAKLETGISQADEGQLLNHEEVMANIKRRIQP